MKLNYKKTFLVGLAFMSISAFWQLYDNVIPLMLKDTFGVKAKMLTHEEAHTMIGHDVGGVCPFALPEDVKVYLDESLRRFETVFPAAGSSNSAVEMTCEELERYASNFTAWVDVCKGWREEE